MDLDYSSLILWLEREKVVYSDELIRTAIACISMKSLEN